MAKEWGYSVEISGVGRAVQPDPWQRDKELGYATSVACFKKGDTMQDSERGSRGREDVQKLGLPSKGHKLFAEHVHEPSPSSQKPKPLKEVAESVVEKMNQFHEVFMRVEELWFEPEISVACGGWIEVLIRAAEESESLNVVKEGGIGSNETIWMIQRLSGPTDPVPPWTAESESSLDYIPAGWEPDEGGFEGSAVTDGDVSWNTNSADVQWGNANNNEFGGWGSADEAEHTFATGWNGGKPNVD